MNITQLKITLRCISFCFQQGGPMFETWQILMTYCNRQFTQENLSFPVSFQENQVCVIEKRTSFEVWLDVICSVKHFDWLVHYRLMLNQKLGPLFNLHHKAAAESLPQSWLVRKSSVNSLETMTLVRLVPFFSIKCQKCPSNVERVAELVKRFSICTNIQETVKIAQDRVKLFLLHAALLRKLSLKYRAHRTLLNEFCEENDGKVFPFDEVSKNLPFISTHC